MSFAKAYNHTDVIQELEAWMATPVEIKRSGPHC